MTDQMAVDEDLVVDLARKVAAGELTEAEARAALELVAEPAESTGEQGTA